MCVILFCVVVAALLCEDLRSKAVAAFVVVVVLSSCVQSKYVPVPQIRYEAVNRDVVVRDSVYVCDSERVVNDTVYVTRYVYRGSQTSDTVYVARCDSVSYPVEVEVTKEVVPGWSLWSLGVSVVLLCAGVVRVLWKLKR